MVGVLLARRFGSPVDAHPSPYIVSTRKKGDILTSVCFTPHLTASEFTLGRKMVLIKLHRRMQSGS